MRICFRAAWIVVLGLLSASVWAQDARLAASFGCTYPDPGGMPGDTRSTTYEIWLYNDPSNTPKLWGDAKNFAESRSVDLEGSLVFGQLAALSNSDEEECVLDEGAALGLGVNQQLWIGLSRVMGGLVYPGGWSWLNEPANTYDNWGNGEPNNAGGNEDHATIGRYGYAITDGHNDEDENRGSVYGFVVEYDVPSLGIVDLDEKCTVGDPCPLEFPSANPVPTAARPTITLPANTQYQGGSEANIEVFRFEGISCTPWDGVDFVSTFQLQLGAMGETIDVPDYLCNEEIIVIRSALTNVIIDSQVVESQFSPADFDLMPDICAALQGTQPPVDFGETDILAYLPSSGIWGPGGSFAPRLDPYAHEATFDCINPSRMRTKGNEYFLVNPKFNFDTSEQEQQMANLIYRKLERLLEGLREAEAAGAIPKNGDAQKMQVKVIGAMADVEKGAYSGALQKIDELFRKFLNRAKFDTVPGNFNYEGETISGASNIRYLLDVYLGA